MHTKCAFSVGRSRIVARAEKTITFKLLGGIDLVMVGASKGVSGLVAQLEERRLCEAEALGSNPSESMYNMHQAI